jgi:hypothetical protein
LLQCFSNIISETDILSLLQYCWNIVAIFCNVFCYSVLYGCVIVVQILISLMSGWIWRLLPQGNDGCERVKKLLHFVMYREKQQEMTIVEFARLSNDILLFSFRNDRALFRQISAYDIVIQWTVSSCINFSRGDSCANDFFRRLSENRVRSLAQRESYHGAIIFSAVTYNEPRFLPGAVHRRRCYLRQWFFVSVLGRATGSGKRGKWATFPLAVHVCDACATRFVFAMLFSYTHVLSICTRISGVDRVANRLRTDSETEEKRERERKRGRDK